MESEWATYSLKDVGRIVTGKTPPGTLAKYFGGSALFVTPTDMSEEKQISRTARTLSSEGMLKQGKIMFEKAIVVSCIGWQMGKTAVVHQLASTNQQINSILVDESLVNFDYLYYTLKHKRQEIFNLGATATRTPILKKSLFEKISFRAPALEEQKCISQMLGSLDDKIELNRRMNGTLEGMAQALFKSWFVDFDPVIDNALAAGNPIPEELADRAEVRRAALANGTANRQAAKPFPAAFQQTEELGWIPVGWEAEKLGNLLEVKYGKDHKKLNDGSIPVFGSGGLMRLADASLHLGESVLIPRKGTLSNIMYLNEEFWTVDTMFYTLPKVKFVLKYAFYFLRTLDFASMNVGSAVPSMTTNVLNELPTILPGDLVRELFDSELTFYFRKKAACDAQSATLTKLRDTLLPKLISGELRIPDAEKLAEAALA
jgi:type I restriction enzyme S subunit